MLSFNYIFEHDVACNSWMMSLQERELAWTTTTWCGCSIRISLCERQHLECNCHGRWEVQIALATWSQDIRTDFNDIVKLISTYFNWFQLIPRNGQVDSVKLFNATVHNHADTRLHEEVLVNGAWASLGRVKPWPRSDFFCLYRRVGVFICWMMLDDVMICALQFSVYVDPLFIWCLHLGLRSLCSKRASSSRNPQRQSNRLKLQCPRPKNKLKRKVKNQCQRECWILAD
jgi:hypothetical protein